MAMTPEELQVLQRIENQLSDMPFYVVEYIVLKSVQFIAGYIAAVSIPLPAFLALATS